MVHFQDRMEAGKILAEKLFYLKKEEPLILAIPRGGVPVAYEVAKKLQTDLDLLFVKKIGAPGNPELAIGAVGEDGTPWLNTRFISRLGLKTAAIKGITNRKIEEVREQVHQLRGAQAPTPVEGRILVIIDDGIATGATLLAAVQLLRARKPKKIIVATPVAPESTLEEIRKVADEVQCLETPFPFIAVGDWYQDFGQVSDAEVLRLMSRKSRSRNQVDNEAMEIVIRDGSTELHGDLQLIKNMKGLIIFAHGSGSSRHSPRNQFVAKELNKIGFGTLLADLLTEKESVDRKNVFDIELLIDRLLKATEAVIPHLPQGPLGAHFPIAYFGASTGAAAALGAVAKSPREIFAVVSRGGRPDLAGKYLTQVRTPTLLIVGGADTEVILLNEIAAGKLKVSKMVLVPKATHLFEEPGALEEVVEYAADWFLQFTPALKKPLPPLESIVREIEERVHPILQEGAWNDLIERLAKSRIVMLGEASHGTAEFYSVRRMISEKLIRDHNFDFIAVEGDWPDAQKLNDYIRGIGQRQSAKDIMRQFHRWPTWMWANDETAAMIEWMQNYQTGFYGLDVYSLFESMDEVQAYAQRISPEFGEEVKGRYSCFSPFERNEKSYAQHLLKFDEGCRQEVLENLRKMLSLRLDDHRIKNGDLFSAQQNARIVKNSEEYYRAMLFGGPESWNIRDQHMFETLELLLNRNFQSRKCIVWAHNSHIGDYHATDMLDEGYVNLGGLAREKFGPDQVALVGLGTYHGEVLASPAWYGPETITPLPAAKENSFEFYCHKASQTLRAPRFYMLFDDAARKTVLGTRHYGHRAVGVVYDPRFESHGRNYVPTTLAKRYDAFIYIDKTSALRSIPTLTSLIELPETWPGGI